MSTLSTASNPETASPAPTKINRQELRGTNSVLQRKGINSAALSKAADSLIRPQQTTGRKTTDLRPLKTSSCASSITCTATLPAPASKTVQCTPNGRETEEPDGRRECRHRRKRRSTSRNRRHRGTQILSRRRGTNFHNSPDQFPTSPRPKWPGIVCRQRH